MNQMQHQVTEFHRATGGLGDVSTPEGRLLRAKLIMEEAVETVAALGFEATGEIILGRHDAGYFPEEYHRYERSYPEPDYLDYIDGLCDLLYVTFGGAVNLGDGFDIRPHFNEVHAANMSKLTGPKRKDGKQLKPEGWKPPDHAAILKGHPFCLHDGVTDNSDCWRAREWYKTVAAHEDQPANPTNTTEPITDSPPAAARMDTSASPPMEVDWMGTPLASGVTPQLKERVAATLASLAGPAQAADWSPNEADHRAGRPHVKRLFGIVTCRLCYSDTTNP